MSIRGKSITNAWLKGASEPIVTDLKIYLLLLLDWVINGLFVINHIEWHWIAYTGHLSLLFISIGPSSLSVCIWLNYVSIFRLFSCLIHQKLVCLYLYPWCPTFIQRCQIIKICSLSNYVVNLIESKYKMNIECLLFIWFYISSFVTYLFSSVYWFVRIRITAVQFLEYTLPNIDRIVVAFLSSCYFWVHSGGWH